MVSTHTLHHSKGKWEKASADKKNISILQRKVNDLRKQLEKAYKKNKQRKEQAKKDANLINELKLKIKDKETWNRLWAANTY